MLMFTKPLKRIQSCFSIKAVCEVSLHIVTLCGKATDKGKDTNLPYSLLSDNELEGGVLVLF